MKKFKTAQGSSALRDTHPNITNKVYKILNSHNTFIFTKGAMPGDDFVPTLPPRKMPTTAEPVEKHKRKLKSALKSQAQPVGPGVGKDQA